MIRGVRCVWKRVESQAIAVSRCQREYARLLADSKQTRSIETSQRLNRKLARTRARPRLLDAVALKQSNKEPAAEVFVGINTRALVGPRVSPDTTSMPAWKSSR